MPDKETKRQWPKQKGRGFNTSDGYRFFHKDKANAHQKRVDDKKKDE